jgi:hypothetical protein
MIRRIAIFVALWLAVACGSSAVEPTDAGPTDTVPTDTAPTDVEPLDTDTSPPADILDIPENIDTGPEPCIPAHSTFLNQVAGPIFSRCVGCHNAYGLVAEFAKKNQTTYWLGRFPGDPDYLSTNLEVIRTYGGLMIPKASGVIGHEGGTLLEEGSEDYALFAELVQQLNSGNVCETVPLSDILEGGQILTARETLRKASLTLTSRLPGVAELAEVTEENLGDGIDALMTQPAFYDRMEEAFNDLFYTNRFHPNLKSTSALGNLPNRSSPPSAHNYYRAGIFHPCKGVSTKNCCDGSTENPCCDDLYPDQVTFCEQGYLNANLSVAHVPLKLVRHILKNDLPFSTLLTADYTMVNSYVAAVYGLDVPFDDWMDISDYKPVQVVETDANILQDGPIPHAGVLSTHMFLRRYITTVTNLNRLRSRTVYDKFVAIDLMKLVEFTVGQDDAVANNPTLEGKSCRVCHAAMDPLGAHFMNRDRRGAYRLNEGIKWKNHILCSAEKVGMENLCTREPAYKGTPLDPDSPRSPLQQLGDRIVDDPRFGFAMVRHLYRTILGVAIVDLPDRLNDPDQAAKALAFDFQSRQMEATRQVFVESGFNIKTAIRHMLLGPIFRTETVPPLAEDDPRYQALVLSEVGGGHLLTPEQLHRRILATTGYAWQLYYSTGPNFRLTVAWQYPILYGGIDSKHVLKRDRQANGITAAIARRMASMMSCLVVPQDFAINDPTQRRFFHAVELDTDPTTAEGEALIRQSIQTLLLLLLGQEVALEDPEIGHLFELWTGVRATGQAALATGSAKTNLDGWCQAKCVYGEKTWDYKCQFEGAVLYDTLETHTPVVADPTYSVRAWQVVMAALFTDYEFLYE